MQGRTAELRLLPMNCDCSATNREARGVGEPDGGFLVVVTTREVHGGREFEASRAVARAARRSFGPRGSRGAQTSRLFFEALVKLNLKVRVASRASLFPVLVDTFASASAQGEKICLASTQNQERLFYIFAQTRRVLAIDGGLGAPRSLFC